MPDAWLDIVARLALAAVAGAAIGLNRDLHHKQAGVRTNALVSLGSALAILVVMPPGEDPTHRIDAMSRAEPIQYSDLNYSPREGEVRTYLMDWANYRYTISRDTIAKKYPLNYYFLSGDLASQLMTEDNQNHLVSQVIGGQIEQSDVEVKDVTITAMSQETVQGAVMARGTALLALDKLYSPSHSRDPRTEHWMLSITYYLNPKQVSDQAKIYPQYEFINPLGLTITEFHENRVSVNPIAPGTAAATVDGAVR